MALTFVCASRIVPAVADAFTVTVTISGITLMLPLPCTVIIVMFSSLMSSSPRFSSPSARAPVSSISAASSTLTHFFVIQCLL